MNQRDLELLSSYLDGQLSPSDSARLEGRLRTDPQLVTILNDLRDTRTLLRKLPARRAPRNFTLTRKMVGQNPPLPKAYPFFRFATALATLLFVFSFGLNSVSRMTAPAFGMGGGGGVADSQEGIELYAEEAPAMATEAPATEAPIEPPFAAVPAPTMTAPAQEDALRSAETPTLPAAEMGNAVAQKQLEKPAVVPFTWQIVLGVVALLSALLMVLMRNIATNHWR
jgi:anti-sigma factor RsiW